MRINLKNLLQMIPTDVMNLLISKLRSPLSIDFISDNILKMNRMETISILNELIEDGVIIKQGEYYVLKSNK